MLMVQGVELVTKSNRVKHLPSTSKDGHEIRHRLHPGRERNDCAAMTLIVVLEKLVEIFRDVTTGATTRIGRRLRIEYHRGIPASVVKMREPT
jgi:hypothetical protein